MNTIVCLLVYVLFAAVTYHNVKDCYGSDDVVIAIVAWPVYWAILAVLLIACLTVNYVYVVGARTWARARSRREFPGLPRARAKTIRKDAL